LLAINGGRDAAVDALRDAQTPEDDRAEDSWADYS